MIAPQNEYGGHLTGLQSRTVSYSRPLVWNLADTAFDASSTHNDLTRQR